MNWITKFSIKNAGLIFILMILLFGGGLYAVRTMKIENLPNVDIPYLQINIIYTGASPEQTLNDVVKPVEEKLSTVKGLKNLYTAAAANGASITMELDMDSNVNEAVKDVQNAVSKVKLPEGARTPEISKRGPSADPIFMFAMNGGGDEQTHIQHYLDNVVRPQLASIPGVSKADINGASDKKIYVKVKPDKLKEYRIPLDLVRQTLIANNINVPTGEVQINDLSMTLQIETKIKSVDELKNLSIPIVVSGPQPRVTSIKISDIADVTHEVGEMDSITRLNSSSAVVVSIFPNVDANAAEIVSLVKEKLSALQLPDGYSIATLRDDSIQVEKSVNSMLREAGFGALLAAIVTLLFLRNMRSTIIALLSIPMSILVTMIIMKYMGYSLNMMTLAGIAVAIGRVVDDSIVVIENIYRCIQITPKEKRGLEFVLTASKEVSQAILSSTVTTIAVFGPMAFVPGIVGKFFAPFAWSVTISLAFSLLIAITLVPLLSKLFLLHLDAKPHKESWVQRIYKGILKWSLQHKWIVILFSVAMLIGSSFLVPFIPRNLFPADKVTTYRFTADLTPGSSMDKTNEIAARVEQILSDTKALDNFTTIMKPSHVSIQMTMKEGADNTAFEEKVRNELKGFEKSVSTSFSGKSGTGSGTLYMVVNGPDLASIKKGADELEKAIQTVPGLADVRSNLEGIRKQISISVDNQKAAEKGLQAANVQSAIRNLISGSTVTKVTLDGKSTEVNVGLQSDPVNSIEQIKNQQIASPIGELVAIADIATVEETTSVTSINRLNQQEYVAILGKIVSQNSSGVQEQIEQKLKEVQIPQGVTYYFDGEAKILKEGFRNMIMAIVVSVILVYLVMMVSFGEMLAPLSILFSLPFIFVGAFIGLYVTGESLGMPALVGILMLIGIVVTNAIVLIDRIIQNRHKGKSLYDSIIEAGVTRVRPILMTALATVGALIPLAVTAEGGLISRSLAIVVISGLTTSTLLTLVIVPIAYTLLEQMRNRLVSSSPFRSEKRHSGI